MGEVDDGADESQFARTAAAVEGAEATGVADGAGVGVREDMADERSDTGEGG